jgi:hypothetical protein
MRPGAAFAPVVDMRYSDTPSSVPHMALYGSIHTELRRNLFIYNIFTLFLRHLYDLPRPVRHTLQRM